MALQANSCILGMASGQLRMRPREAIQLRAASVEQCKRLSNIHVAGEDALDRTSASKTKDPADLFLLYRGHVSRK